MQFECNLNAIPNIFGDEKFGFIQFYVLGLADIFEGTAFSDGLRK